MDCFAEPVIGRAFARPLTRNDGEMACVGFLRHARDLGINFPHATVDHAKHQYVVGAVHTQTIEGFWRIFKRCIVGSFPQGQRQENALYVAEFQFRYNNRLNDGIFGTAIAGA